MASEVMNIPALNTVLLATPKSSIEQSIGRILRLKPEERTVMPLIFDVLDLAFGSCNGQWLKRRKFYRECGYVIRWSDENTTTEEEEEGEKEKKVVKGVPLFVDEDTVPAVLTIETVGAFVDAASTSSVPLKKSKKTKDVVKEEKGKALFVSDD
jgi:superfamily II DNA or RNA helicase